jgi:hypothetical protein
LLLRLPLALFRGLCGYFMAEETDVMVVFSKWTAFSKIKVHGGRTSPKDMSEIETA